MGLVHTVTCDSGSCKSYVEFNEFIFGMGITNATLQKIGWEVNEVGKRKVFFCPDCSESYPYTKYLERFKESWMTVIPNTQKKKKPSLKIFPYYEYGGEEKAREEAIKYIRHILDSRKPNPIVPSNSGIPKSIVEIRTTYYLKKLRVTRTEHKFVLTMKGGKKFSRSITLYGREGALQKLQQIYQKENI